MIQIMNVAIPTLQSRIIHKDCLSCGKVINHPICPECISKEFEQWISRYPELKNKIIKKIKKFINSHKHFTDKSQTCVACKKKSVYICPYCFTEFILYELKKAKASTKALAMFLFLFNFDFEHEGYWKTGERLGVW